MEHHLAILAGYVDEIRSAVESGDTAAVQAITKATLPSTSTVVELIAAMADGDAVPEASATQKRARRRSSLQGDAGAITSLAVSVANVKRVSQEVIGAAKKFCKDASNRQLGLDLLRHADELNRAALSLRAIVAAASAPPAVESLAEEDEEEVEVPPEFESLKSTADEVLALNATMARAVREGQDSEAHDLADDMAKAVTAFITAGKALLKGEDGPRVQAGLRSTGAAAFAVIDAAEKLGQAIEAVESGEYDEEEAVEQQKQVARDLNTKSGMLVLEVYALLGIWKPFGITTVTEHVVRARIEEVQALTQQIDIVGKRLDEEREPERIDVLNALTEDVNDAVALLANINGAYKSDPTEETKQKLVSAVNGMVLATKTALTVALRDDVLASLARSRNAAQYNAGDAAGQDRKILEDCASLCRSVAELARAASDDVRVVDAASSAVEEISSRIKADTADNPTASVLRITSAHLADTMSHLIEAARRTAKNPSDTMADKQINYQIEAAARAVAVITGELSGRRARQNALDLIAEREAVMQARREQEATERRMHVMQIRKRKSLVNVSAQATESSDGYNEHVEATHILCAAVADLEKWIGAVEAQCVGQNVPAIAGATSEINAALGDLPGGQSHAILVTRHAPKALHWVPGVVAKLRDACVLLELHEGAKAGSDLDRHLVTKSLRAIRDIAQHDIGEHYLRSETLVFRLRSAATLMSKESERRGGESAYLDGGSRVGAAAAELYATSCFLPQHVADAADEASNHMSVLCYAVAGGEDAPRVTPLVVGVDWLITACRAGLSRSDHNVSLVHAAAAAVLAEMYTLLNIKDPADEEGRKNRKSCADEVHDCGCRVYASVSHCITLLSSSVPHAESVEKATQEAVTAVRTLTAVVSSLGGTGSDAECASFIAAVHAHAADRSSPDGRATLLRTLKELAGGAARAVREVTLKAHMKDYEEVGAQLAADGTNDVATKLSSLSKASLGVLAGGDVDAVENSGVGAAAAAAAAVMRVSSSEAYSLQCPSKQADILHSTALCLVDAAKKAKTTSSVQDDKALFQISRRLLRILMSFIPSS